MSWNSGLGGNDVPEPGVLLQKRQQVCGILTMGTIGANNLRQEGELNQLHGGRRESGDAVVKPTTDEEKITLSLGKKPVLNLPGQLSRGKKHQFKVIVLIHPPIATPRPKETRHVHPQPWAEIPFVYPVRIDLWGDYTEQPFPSRAPIRHRTHTDPPCKP
jgi:hypothetical protein